MNVESDAAMRVLLVTKGLDLGGIERVVSDLAIGLAERGVDVDVALVNSDRDRLAGPIEAAGIDVKQLDGSDRIGVGAGRRLARLVRHGGYDVVHVHGPLPSVVARVARRRPAGSGAGAEWDGRRSSAVVTTSHTPWGSLRRPTRWAWQATATRDDASIAVSSAVAASLPTSVGSRAVVIPHGIDTARTKRAIASAVDRTFGPASSAESSGPAETSSPTVHVVAVASHRDAKNYPNLLRAVRVAIDLGASIRLVSIGDGPNLGRHVELARWLSIEDAVDFVPAVDDVLPEIAAADMLAVASDYEGQPIVVAEALALGVPVVATAVGRVPELVNSEVGRVVAPGDPAVLGAALAELAASPELRASMSETARRQRNAWTLDDVIDAHIALYRTVAGK